MTEQEIETNIARLEHSIALGCFAPNYVAQCRDDIATYRERLAAFADGEAEDLFENIDALPGNVRDILCAFNDREPGARTCEDLEQELEPLGYAFEWGLCCVPHSLRKIRDNDAQQAVARVTGSKILPFRSICRGLYEAVKAETGADLIFKRRVPGMGDVLYAYDSKNLMTHKAAKTGEFFELMPRMV